MLCFLSYAIICVMIFMYLLLLSELDEVKNTIQPDALNVAICQHRLLQKMLQYYDNILFLGIGGDGEQNEKRKRKRFDY